MSNFIDMTGWKMWEHGVPDSRLTVIERTEDYISPGGHRETQWICECNCDKHTRICVTRSNLKEGSVKSCGCYRKERTIKQNKKNNIFDLNLKDDYGLYGVGICNNTKNKFYFDMNDYDKIKEYCWFEIVGKDGYHRLMANIQGKHANRTMAQLLVGNHYDHIDRNPLNNRKYNLRKASKNDNARNKSKQKNNTSGVSGVGWHKCTGKWCARISINNRPMWLGCFNSKEDAIKARLEAEAKYFGDFAPQIHLFKQYKINLTEDL